MWKVIVVKLISLILKIPRPIKISMYPRKPTNVFRQAQCVRVYACLSLCVWMCVSSFKIFLGGSRVVMVSSSQPRGRRFEPYIWLWQWFIIWHQYLLVPGSGLESDLSQLWELASQSSWKYMFKLKSFVISLFKQTS